MLCGSVPRFKKFQVATNVRECGGFAAACRGITRGVVNGDEELGVCSEAKRETPHAAKRELTRHSRDTSTAQSSGIRTATGGPVC